MNLHQSRESDISLEPRNQYYLDHDDSMDNHSNTCCCCCCYRNIYESNSTLSSNESSTLNVNIQQQQSFTSSCLICNNR